MAGRIAENQAFSVTHTRFSSVQTSENGQFEHDTIFAFEINRDTMT